MRAAGSAFEQRACDALERAGLTVLARNYTTRYGDTVVFVEVRHRLHPAYGGAAMSITAGKRAKLVQTAQLWLAAHARYAQHACRFDVVTYDGPEQNATMQWLRGAFEAA